MSRTFSYEYNSAYDPSAPFLPIAIDGYDATKPPIIVHAFVDSGADGTMLPLDILRAVNADFRSTVIAMIFNEVYKDLTD